MTEDVEQSNASVLQRSGMTVARLYVIKENTREGKNSERRREKVCVRKEKRMSVM